MRSVAKVGAQITKKFVRDSGLVDENTANIVEGVAGGVQNQAEASRDASVTDRLKMAGKVFIYIYIPSVLPRIFRVVIGFYIGFSAVYPVYT